MSEVAVFDEVQMQELFTDPKLRSFVENHVEAFWVTTIPADIVAVSFEWRTWSVRVSRKSPGRWAVENHGENYDEAGESEYEDLPSSRTDEFKTKYRHSLEKAVEIAFRVCRTVRMNGTTAEGYSNWYRMNHMKEGS